MTHFAMKPGTSHIWDCTCPIGTDHYDDHTGHPTRRAQPHRPDQQGRDHHAPDADTTAWSPAAAASIAAADALADTLTRSHRWERIETTAGARERRGRLVDHLVADAKRAGALQERAETVQRVYAFAASLSDERERLLAAKVAERIENGL